MVGFYKHIILLLSFCSLLFSSCESHNGDKEKGILSDDCFFSIMESGEFEGYIFKYREFNSAEALAKFKTFDEMVAAMKITDDSLKILTVEGLAWSNMFWGLNGMYKAYGGLETTEIDGVEFRIPVRGDQLALLELSARNAKEMRLNALKQQEHTDPDAYKNMIMESLQKQIGMKELPRHIECFDNSNIQGTNPVSACVVFRNGVPSKKDYRHFKVKTVVGANDYATMKEVVNRRYSRVLEENPEDIPQLVVIDGGKGQLAFAYEALAELGLTDKLTVIALAERMEEVYRVGDPYPMFIDRNSPALKVLQHIRDEAHRFGITFHRSLRSKSQVESALGSIKGVGPKTEQRLLLHFGSVARIAAASLEDVAALVGPALAERILNTLNNES